MVETSYVAREMPLNTAQIGYDRDYEQWLTMGEVLRCHIHDTADGQQAVIEIDGVDLSMEDFGRLLCAYAGWGMRIEFVPDDAIHRRPAIEVVDPDC